MNSGYLLDTNVPSEQIRLRPDPGVDRWLDTQPDRLLFLSSISIGEIRIGVLLMGAGRRRTELEHWLEEKLLPSFAGRILPIDVAVAERWAYMTAKRKLSGTPLEAADGLIAATALEHNLTLVTRNVKDFANLELSLLNPWEL